MDAPNREERGIRKSEITIPKIDKSGIVWKNRVGYDSNHTEESEVAILNAEKEHNEN